MIRPTIGLLSAALCAAPVLAQVPADVPRDHWAYGAVEHLLSKGIVQNYPNGAFLGNRTLTRYEMAALLKRLIDGLVKAPVAVETPDGVRREELDPIQQAIAALQGDTAALKVVQLSADEVTELRKLLKEFLPELSVLGADLKALKEKFDALDTRLVDMVQDIKDLKDHTTAIQKNLDLLNSKRADGYIQARYSVRATRDRVRAPENSGQDTTRGNSGNVDTFHVRRARLNVRGDVSDRAGYRIQLDARTAASAGAQEITVKEAYVVVKNFPLQLKPNGAVPPWWQADFWMGQSVTPFGHYLPFSSSDRSAPERYIAFSDTGSGLFANQDYEKGAGLKGKLFNKYEFQAGFYNGNGIASNDLGRRKDFIGQVGTLVTPTWRVGVSAYDGEGATTGTAVAADGFIGLVGSETPTTDQQSGVLLNANGNPVVLKTRQRKRQLFGADTQIQLPLKAELKLEYVRGKGGQVGSSQTVAPKEYFAYVDGREVEGYYVELNKHYGGEIVPEPGRPGIPRLKVVGAYELYNRNARPDKTGPFSRINIGTAAAPDFRNVTKAMFEESRIHAGLLYQMDAATRLRLWYEDPIHNPHLPTKPDFQNHTAYWTFEVQVKF